MLTCRVLTRFTLALRTIASRVLSLRLVAPPDFPAPIEFNHRKIWGEDGLRRFRPASSLQHPVSKFFRSNTYKTFCKCSFQRTYTKPKSFSSNTYKKPGAGSLLLACRSWLVSGGRSLVASPSSLRWSPVVFQRKSPSISFFFMPLRGLLLLIEGGYTPPPLIASSLLPIASHHSSVTSFCLLLPFLLLSPPQGEFPNVR
jgi:hypothetical protein